MAGLMNGKKILIMGLRNKWSIAWGITKKLFDEGAELAFTYQGEREKTDIIELLAALGGGGAAGKEDGGMAGSEGGAAGSEEYVNKKFPTFKCDLSLDAEIDEAFDSLAKAWGRLDGLVHAVANARSEDLKNDFILTSREGFLHALDISAYTLVYVARKAAELAPKEGGAIITLTYMGSERVFPGYNVMGVAKAALEAAVRYLAYSLGAKGIRINAISSGPIKTLSAKAVRNFSNMMNVVDEKAPLKRGVDAEEIGGAALYLLSDLSTAVTGGVHYVDCGYNIMGT